MRYSNNACQVRCGRNGSGGGGKEWKLPLLHLLAKFAINFSLAPLAFVCTLDSSLNEKKFKSKLGNFATPHIRPPCTTPTPWTSLCLHWIKLKPNCVCESTLYNVAAADAAGAAWQGHAPKNTSTNNEWQWGLGLSPHPLPALSSLSSWSPVCVTTSATTSNALSAQAVTRTTRNPSLCPQHGTTNAAATAGATAAGGGGDTIAYATTACSQLDTHGSLEQQLVLVCVWQKGPSIWTDLVFERRTAKGTCRNFVTLSFIRSSVGSSQMQFSSIELVFRLIYEYYNSFRMLFEVDNSFQLVWILQKRFFSFFYCFNTKLPSLKLYFNSI